MLPLHFIWQIHLSVLIMTCYQLDIVWAGHRLRGCFSYLENHSKISLLHNHPTSSIAMFHCGHHHMPFSRHRPTLIPKLSQSNHVTCHLIQVLLLMTTLKLAFYCSSILKWLLVPHMHHTLSSWYEFVMYHFFSQGLKCQYFWHILDKTGKC